MYKKIKNERIDIRDGYWHEVKNPIESTQYDLGFLYEETEQYILESHIYYSICKNSSTLEKFRYWTSNRITLINPEINPFNERDRYFFNEKFIDYKTAKEFVFKWNEDAHLFISTLFESPNEELLTKYYKIQSENKYNNILEFIK